MAADICYVSFQVLVEDGMLIFVMCYSRCWFRTAADICYVLFQVLVEEGMLIFVVLFQVLVEDGS